MRQEGRGCDRGFGLNRVPITADDIDSRMCGNNALAKRELLDQQVTYKNAFGLRPRTAAIDP